MLSEERKAQVLAHFTRCAEGPIGDEPCSLVPEMTNREALSELLAKPEVLFFFVEEIEKEELAAQNSPQLNLG